MGNAGWRKALPFLAAAGLLAGCGGSEGGAPPLNEDEAAAWMDGAEVRVAIDAATHRETVTLRDAASGRSERMDDEEIAGDVAEFEDAQ